jgi:hypothetical protein
MSQLGCLVGMRTFCKEHAIQSVRKKLLAQIHDLDIVHVTKEDPELGMTCFGQNVSKGEIFHLQGLVYM